MYNEAYIALILYWWARCHSCMQARFSQLDFLSLPSKLSSGRQLPYFWPASNSDGITTAYGLLLQTTTRIKGN